MKRFHQFAFLVAVLGCTGTPARSETFDNCKNIDNSNGFFDCRLSPSGVQPRLYTSKMQLNKVFLSLPSCELVDSKLESLSEVAAVLSTSVKELGPNNLIKKNIIPKEIAGNANSPEIDSAVVFKTRLMYSPLAKQYYYGFLNKKETVNGNFNRPIISFNSGLDRYNTYTKSRVSSSKSSSNTYYNDLSSQFKLEYDLLDLQNFFATQSLKEDAKASYQEFIGSAVNDSLDSVLDYYRVKESILSSSIAEAQYIATKDQLDRLEILEAKGLQSVLDISRANITEISQSVSFATAKNQLSQSYSTLLNDLNLNSVAGTNSRFSDLVSSACWSKPPIDSLTVALNNNTGIQQLRSNLKSSKLKGTSISAGMLPELTIGISYSPANSWGDINGSGNTNDYTISETTDAYLSMSWDIFDFGQTMANKASQDKLSLSLASQLTEKISEVETGLVNAFIQYISSTLNVVDLTNAARKSAENYTKAVKSYKRGFLDQTDVTGIFTQLTSVTQSLISNLSDRNSAAVDIAKLVQEDGFDSIDFRKALNDLEKSMN